MKTNNPSVILCYADWCGHCARFKPTFKNKYSKTISINNFTPCMMNSDDIDSSMNIRAFPTLMFYDKNGHLRFKQEGILNEDEILHILNKIKYE